MFGKVIGVQQNNSLNYIEHVFKVLNTGGTVLNLKTLNENIEIPKLQLAERRSTDLNKGWYQGPRYVPSESEEIAQILFSSGTEGHSKAICISHAALSNTTQRLNKVLNIDSTVREYIGVPVFYSFGAGRCRVVSAAGGEFYLPKDGFDPLEISEMLQNGEINSISAVPTLWRIILENPDLMKDVGDKVKWIEIGSQDMTAEEKSQMVSIFPNANIVQHYGLTEASRSTFLKIHKSSKSELASVGQALYGIDVKVSSDGRIKIRGPHLATTILRKGIAEPICNSEGWFYTGDKGRMEGEHLVFEGRIDDIINCGGVKLSPETLDRQLYKELGINQGIHTIKCQDLNLGETVGLVLSNDVKLNIEKVKKAIAKVMLSYNLNLGNNINLSYVDEFPHTDTGKLQRKKLIALVSSQANTTTTSPSKNSTKSINNSDEELVINMFKRILGFNSIAPQESLRSLGADSLSILQIRIALAKSLDHIPDDWIDLSISKLANSVTNKKLTKSTSKSAKIESYIIMRAIAIILVVLHHFNLVTVGEGATTLLFVVSGTLFFTTNLDSITKGTHIGRLWIGLIVLLCTLIPITAFQAVMHSYFGSDWHITLLIPYENISAYLNDITDTIDTQHHVHWLWFIHAYLQMFALLAMLLSIKHIRQVISKNLFASLLIAYYVSEIFAVTFIAYDSYRQDIFHSAAILQYSPLTLMPVVLFGGLIAIAKAPSERAHVILAGVIYIIINLTGIFTQGGLFTLIGVVILLWYPKLPVAKVLHTPFMRVAESSLFIYLTHMPIKFGLEKVIPFTVPTELGVIFSVVMAMLIWPIWSSLIVRRIRKLKLFS
jgi:acyl-CoA synthetase (AMP-forming)/AMP-acid ligase II